MKGSKLKFNAFTRSGTGPPTKHKPTIDDRLPEDHFNEELEDSHPTHNTYFISLLSSYYSHNITYNPPLPPVNFTHTILLSPIDMPRTLGSL